jgi:4-aminobutyrate aminotransferase/(S)-3-amino-2-methylpropionate transaminase
MDSSHIGGLGGTYGGNPIACAAALAAIEIIEGEKLVERARHLGEILFSSLREIAAKHPEIGEIRGRGAMVAIELVKAGTKDPNPELMAKVIKYCQSKGVLILTAGSYGNVIRFLPPLVITDELLKDALSVLAEAFDSVA